VILEENEKQHQEAMRKVASLEVEVAKWRATARIVWRVERPKVANATVAFIETVKSNHQFSSKVGSVLAMLLRTRLDGDELSTRSKACRKRKRIWLARWKALQWRGMSLLRWLLS